MAQSDHVYLTPCCYDERRNVMHTEATPRASACRATDLEQSMRSVVTQTKGRAWQGLLAVLAD